MTKSKIKKNIWESFAEKEIYEIGFKMGYQPHQIDAWQQRRILESLLVFVGVSLIAYFYNPLGYLAAIGLAVLYYLSKKSSLRKKYHNYTFLKQIEFYRFFRLLIPYLYEAHETNRSILSILVQMHEEMTKAEEKTIQLNATKKKPVLDKESAFRKSLSSFITDLSYHPGDIQPYLNFAEDVSGTDRAALMMSTIYDFQNSSPDLTVIQELSKTATEELFEGIQEIIAFKSRKFYFYPTYIVMSCMLPMFGFLVGYMIDFFMNIQL